MKRILIFLSVCMLGTLCVQAKDPWAEHKDSVAARENRPAQRRIAYNNEGSKTNPSQHKPNKPEKVTILPLILQGKPVKVSIYPPSSDDEEQYYAAQKVVRQAYNDWFANAVEYIEYENRKQEFSDVLPILKKGVTIEFVEFTSPSPQDVWVAFENDLAQTQKSCKCSNCLGCEIAGTEKSLMAVYVPADGLYLTLVHELGHTLGIADAYDEGYQENASESYRSKEQVTLTVMYGGDTDLSADDADGLINMIDSWTIFFLKKKYPKDWCKHVSPRVLKGWNSLLRYKSGSSLDRYAMGTSQKLLPKNGACEIENSSQAVELLLPTRNNSQGKMRAAKPQQAQNRVKGSGQNNKGRTQPSNTSKQNNKPQTNKGKRATTK